MNNLYNHISGPLAPICAVSFQTIFGSQILLPDILIDCSDKADRIG